MKENIEKVNPIIPPIYREDVFDVANRGPIKQGVIVPTEASPKRSDAEIEFINNMNA